MEAQQAYVVAEGELIPTNPLPEKCGFTDGVAEHFMSLCQELSATILEQHSKTLKQHGAVKMSFEFPYSGIDTVELNIQDDTLTIERSTKKRHRKSA